MSEDLTTQSIPISSPPTSALEYANLGSIYAQKQQWQKAIASYRAALKLDPQLGGVYRNLAKVFNRIGKPEKADRHWYRALQLQPETADAIQYAQLGDRLAGRKQYRLAIVCLREAIARQPEYLNAYYRLSIIFSELGKHQPATVVCKQAIKQDRHNGTSYYYLALAWQNQAKLNRAKNNYQKALKLDRGLTQARIKLAELHTHRQEWQEALTHYEYLIEHQPNNSQIYHLLGDFWVKQQNWPQAQQAYQQATKLNPQAVKSWYNLGSVARRQLQDALALHAYKQVIKQDYRVSELVIKAGSYCRSLLDKNAAATAEDYHQLGQLLKSRSQFEAAIGCFCAAIRLDPRCWKAYNSIQYTPVARGQLQKLIGFYRHIAHQQPNFPVVWGNLGDVLSQSGDIPGAIECYRRSSYLNAVSVEPKLATGDYHTAKTKAPDFIIIGVAKGGTSSLYYYLGRHPQVILPHKKEINFFSREFDYGKEWYLSHFPSISDRLCRYAERNQQSWFTGEASPNYFSFVVAAERIAQTFPETKLILLLRNPVDRAISWHYHKLNSGLTKLDLTTAITTEMEQIQKLDRSQLCLNGYRPLDNVLRSIYIYQLQQWRKYIPAEQILIIKSEDLYSQPASVMERVFDFIGLPPHQIDDYPICNIGSYQSPGEPIREKLKEFFQPFNQELEAYLSQQFNWD